MTYRSEQKLKKEQKIRKESKDALERDKKHSSSVQVEAYDCAELEKTVDENSTKMEGCNIPHSVWFQTQGKSV